VEKLGCAVETVDFDARAVDTHADVIRKAFAGGDVDVSVVAFGLLGDARRRGRTSTPRWSSRR
jgi:decaprenylphospho-beta-D-erythro-pentofuranosid-2-ulose 2-reductase